MEIKAALDSKPRAVWEDAALFMCVGFEQEQEPPVSSPSPYQHVWHLQLPSVQLSPVRRDSLFVSSSAPVISFRGGLFFHLSPQCWLSLWDINRWLTDSMCLCVYLHWSNDSEGLRSEALEMLFYLCCRGTIIAETKENQTGFVPVTRVPPSRWTISEGSVWLRARCM